MAARAHAVHDYSFSKSSDRPRRQVWLRDEDYDPVVLPRGREGSLSGGLILSAVLASVLVGGAAYALYWASAPAVPAMAATPALPLQKTWEVDPAVTQANVAFALQGRPIAQAAAAPAPVVSPEDLPTTKAMPSREMTADELERRESRSQSNKSEVILDDSAPGFQESLPQSDQQTAPLVDPAVPDAVTPKPEAPATPDPRYPDPTMTPPEMTQPPLDNGANSPKDPANPYDLK
jgi:hypothetical protein